MNTTKLWIVIAHNSDSDFHLVKAFETESAAYYYINKINAILFWLLYQINAHHSAGLDYSIPHEVIQQVQAMGLDPDWSLRDGARYQVKSVELSLQKSAEAIA